MQSDEIEARVFLDGAGTVLRFAIAVNRKIDP
jgi:hypothetical protein